MNQEKSENGIKSPNKPMENNSNCNNHSSKKDIRADNYKQSKVFDIKALNLNSDLNRVDSQNNPEIVENLDFIANKMGLHQKYTNGKPTHNSNECLPLEQSTTSVPIQSNPAINVCEVNKTEEEPTKLIEHHKKTSLMSKILRRLSKPSIFSKDKKQKKTKSLNKQSAESARPSLSSDNKSNTIGDNINHLNPRSKSFRKFFHKFGKGKPKSNMLSDPPSSIGSRPSVSSAVNVATNIDGIGSCNNVYIDKLCKETLEKYNSPSVDCILDHRIGKLLKQQESESSNSEELRDHELKMNCSNHNIVSIFPEDIDTSENKETLSKTDEDKLSPLNVNLNLTSWSAENDRSCHSAMSGNHSETSSNVKLTLSLHGYNAYGLSSSRFNSKSCMEFRSANISPKLKASMENIATFTENMTSSVFNRVSNKKPLVSDMVDHQGEVSPCKTETVEDRHVTVVSDGIINDNKEEIPNVVLRNSERPHEIQLRRSRVASQSSMTRSSLIMVAVSHNTPRSKGVGNHVGTPVYNPDSPMYPGRKLDFEEESKPIEEEKIEKNISEKDGNYFLSIANKYEEEINGKIEIVQRYLDSSKNLMDEDVIGESNTAIGLAKLLLSEKFVQFRGLCDQNLNDSNENGFKTLACDLEGYLTTLEIQMADLDKNFKLIEKIRENNWQMPQQVTVRPPHSGLKKKVVKPQTPKLTPADNKRSVEARRRLAEYKKISASNNNNQGTANLFIIH